MFMRLRITGITFGLIGLSICGVLLAQKPFREWPAIEYDDFPLPPDYQQKAEWTRARLRYIPTFTVIPIAIWRTVTAARSPATGRWIIPAPTGICLKGLSVA